MAVGTYQENGNWPFQTLIERYDDAGSAIAPSPGPRGFVHVVFCPVGVVADSTTVIALQCALATTFLVKSEFLVTATIPAAPAGVLSKCSPQGLCKTQLSVGRGSFLAAYGVGPSYIVSKVLTFTYRKGS